MKQVSALILGIPAIGLALSSTAPIRAETKLIYKNFTPPTHPVTLMAKRWSGEASKASGGEVKFRSEADWINHAAKKGVDGKATLAFFRKNAI